jgi:F-type H+-transporting ATPase subunit delta
VLKGATARRYAQAVFELAIEQRTLDRWLTDLRAIEAYFSNRQLAFILGEPNIQFARKDQVVRDLLADKVQQDVERMYDEYVGQAHAEVTTATPLDDEARDHLRRDLAEITGKRIILHERVDPGILGGAVARVGDTLIDGSVKRRLGLLRQQILRGGTLGGPGDLGDVNGRGPGGPAEANGRGPGDVNGRAPGGPR